MPRFETERRGPRGLRSAARVLLALVPVLCCTEAVQIGEQFGHTPMLAVDAGVSSSVGSGGTSGALFPFVPSAPGDAGRVDAGAKPAAECQPTPCGNVLLACGNCIDDDGDGLVDAADPECLGPCDDSESELFSGKAPRVNGSCRTDCYFDRNSGSGNDGCSWSYRCDPLSIAPDFFPTGDSRCGYDASSNACALSPSERSACQAGCLPLTPNGCDCFGCCELPAGSGRYLWLGSENLDLQHCELETSADPDRCRPCTPVPDCFNPCEECELCLGKTSLPASCGSGPGLRPSCAPGVTPCDPPDSSVCGELEYCITGCCVPVPR